MGQTMDQPENKPNWLSDVIPVNQDGLILDGTNLPDRIPNNWRQRDKRKGLMQNHGRK